MEQTALRADGDGRMSFEVELKSIAERFNQYLLNLGIGQPGELHESSMHLLRTGGKRLRPFLVIRSCELLSGGSENALPAAASLELVHNFTLVHDDIMDRDETRHGAATVHVKYGIPLAILAGDVLFARAFQLLSDEEFRRRVGAESSSRMVLILSGASVKICEGQAMDLVMARSGDFGSTEEYFSMIERKTASLFEAACRLGCVCGGGSTEDEEALAGFGRSFGIAFQMVDDVLGVAGEEDSTGKPVGNDLREGKKTLVLRLALQRIRSAPDREKIISLLGDRNASQSRLAEAVAMIKSTGAESEVRDLARHHSRKARESLQRFPESAAKHSLENLTGFVVERRI